MSAKKLVILDRDGVINADSAHHIRTPDDWQPLPGSLEAICALNQAGFYVAVATNQSGIARGYFTQALLAAIHQKMLTLLSSMGGQIDMLRYCPHGPDENCLCRKPKPGMVLDILSHYSSVSTKNCWMIGDSKRDLEAGLAAKCQPMLVLTGKGENMLTTYPDFFKSIPIFQDLPHAVETLLCL